MFQVMLNVLEYNTHISSFLHFTPKALNIIYFFGLLWKVWQPNVINWLLLVVLFNLDVNFVLFLRENVGSMYD